MIFILFLVHWLILYLLRYVCLYFIWNMSAGMFVAILQEVVSLYDMSVKCWCSLCSSLIDSFLALFYMLFLFNWICVAGMFVVIFTRKDFFLWLWNDYYLISSSLIDSLLAKICISFLFIWIILACMLLAVWQEVNSLYDCEMIIILYPVYWLILYLLKSV